MNHEIEGWRDMLARIGSMTEAELANCINYEVSRYKRPTIIKRLHQRYAKLFTARQREELLRGETLLPIPPAA